MSSIKCQLQNAFLNNLKRKLKIFDGIDTVLWCFCPSHMTLKILFTNPKLLDCEKIGEVLFEEMNNDTFKSLVDLGFRKEFTVDKKGDNELHHVWSKKRTKDVPHGKVKIFASNLLSGDDFGHDLAGSCWKKHDFGKWELVTFVEDN